MSIAAFFIVGFPAALLIGISKGGFGGALGGISVPLLALMIPPTQAAAVILPILCVADFARLRRSYGQWDLKNLKYMLPGGVLGILIGSVSFGLLSERLIGMSIGVISIVFFVLNLLSMVGPVRPTKPTAVKGTFFSSIAGFTSFVAHAGGPPILMYLLPQRMDQARYLATVSCFFLLTNAMKFFLYAILGQFSIANLTISAILMPVVILGVWLGVWLQGKINQAWFYRIARAGLLIAGVQLISKNLP